MIVLYYQLGSIYILSVNNHHIPKGSGVRQMMNFNQHIVAAPHQVVRMNMWLLYDINGCEPILLLFLCFEQLLDIHK